MGIQTSVTMRALVNAQPSATVRSSAGDLSAQLLNVILQEVCNYDCLVMCILCHDHGLLI